MNNKLNQQNDIIDTVSDEFDSDSKENENVSLLRNIFHEECRIRWKYINSIVKEIIPTVLSLSFD